MTKDRKKKPRTSKAAATTASRKATVKPQNKTGSKRWAAEAQLEALELQDRIQEAAYFKAQQRDFEPGFELQDWLEAESELKANVESAMDKSLPKSERAQHWTYKPGSPAANG